ncbi:hypothetical protein ABZ383_23240 [Streptomyces sp. NPDC005900]|uniref:hypothetical protein n=1 Tax=Streptomyces sp. NPDC005900 TaxID=3154569 RepID=UPI0033E07CC3
MTFIEPGLSVRNGFVEGLLADAALSRAARAGQLLDDLQERASPMTDDQLRDGVHQALCRFIQSNRPHARSTASPRCSAAVYASTGPPKTVCPAPDACSTGEAGWSDGNAAQNPAY